MSNKARDFVELNYDLWWWYVVDNPQDSPKTFWDISSSQEVCVCVLQEGFSKDQQRCKKKPKVCERHGTSVGCEILASLLLYYSKQEAKVPWEIAIYILNPFWEVLETCDKNCFCFGLFVIQRMDSERLCDIETRIRCHFYGMVISFT